MGFAQVLQIVFPVVALVGGGYLFGRFRILHLSSLTEVVVYLGGPSLVFVSLLKSSVSAGEIGALVAGALTIVFGVGAIVMAAGRIFSARPGVLYLPAMFMNAGNMLLPLSLFAFGQEGLGRGVVIFSTMALLQSSLGVLIASGRRDLSEMFRLPYIYAVTAAFGLRALGVQVSPVLLRPVELLADLAIPLMLLALGLRLRTVVVSDWRRPLAVTAARVGGGYLVASLFVAVTGVEGITRSTLLLSSVMPSAVINFVFVEKYGGESSDVATAILMSTLVSLMTTPLVLAFGL